MTSAMLMLCALVIEACLGWPKWLYRLARHPVVWIGALIKWLDTQLNRPTLAFGTRYGLGFLTTCVVVATTAGVTILIDAALPDTLIGFGIKAVLASSLLASRSLYQHVADVAAPLAKNDLQGARAAVSMIVGRDPQTLDENGVARASLESLAENSSDGVVAPLFWGGLFGLPGIATYKAINTLDSMVGHRNDRHLAFGGFAARLDDAANYIPARLTGALIAMTSLSKPAWHVMLRDARKHRSPNAGWPESAMAGGLGVRLSGPRSYGTAQSEEPWLNEGADDPGAQDLHRGLNIYIRSIVLAAGCVAILGLAQWTI